MYSQANHSSEGLLPTALSLSVTFGRTKRASYNKPHRTLAVEQRIIFMLKSSCLKYSGLEESLPLGAKGRGSCGRGGRGGRLGWGNSQLEKSWGSTLSGLVETHSLWSRVSYRAGDISLITPGCSPLSEINAAPQEGAMLADISLLTYPLLTGMDTILMVFIPPHTPRWAPTTYSSPGLPFYSKRPITYPTISQNLIIYVPPFETLGISSYH